MISIRVVHSDVNNGEIPFFDGVHIFVQAKNLVTSAARSLLTPQRGKYKGKSPDIVNRFFDNLILGQTEIGSYKLNVIAPIYKEKINNTQGDYCREPFSRSVSNRIISSISKLNAVVETF